MAIPGSSWGCLVKMSNFYSKMTKAKNNSLVQGALRYIFTYAIKRSLGKPLDLCHLHTMGILKVHILHSLTKSLPLALSCPELPKCALLALSLLYTSPWHGCSSDQDDSYSIGSATALAFQWYQICSTNMCGSIIGYLNTSKIFLKMALKGLKVRGLAIEGQINNRYLQKYW